MNLNVSLISQNTSFTVSFVYKKLAANQYKKTLGAQPPLWDCQVTFRIIQFTAASV